MIETDYLELKRELTDNLEKEVVAFLNSKTNGETMIGIDDDGTVAEIDDKTDNGEQVEEYVKEQVGNKQGVSKISVHCDESRVFSIGIIEIVKLKR